MSILCSVSTRGRYDTTLPLTLQSIIFQTKKPDCLIIFDDNDEPRDLRESQTYQYLFQMLDLSGISWRVEYGERKGQHYNHQRANTSGFEWVWRLDDDTIAEPNVLENLWKVVQSNLGVGAVGCSILTPPCDMKPIVATGKIEHITFEPNMQWSVIEDTKEVDHLHCSFLYRAGVVDYNLNLSKVAHREETLFTYALKKAGYRVFITPGITWHLRNKEGGIRDGAKEMFDHDEYIFQTEMNFTVVVLDNGMGDHIVFKHVLPDIKNPLVFSCYPDIVPGRSIAEAYQRFGPDLSKYNVYTQMDKWQWTDSLENAFRKLYNAPKVSS